MTKGFKELEKRLDKMSREAKKLDGEHTVNLTELFPAGFMITHTQSNSIEDFLSDLGVSDQSTFEALPHEDLDKKVMAETDFDSWDKMYEAGTAQYVGKKLGF